MIFIIIPTYNEKDNIGVLVRAIDNLQLPIKLIIVDDNSPDGTAEIIKNISDIKVPVQLIQRPQKLGIGSAYLLGFSQAVTQGAEYIMEMDADLSHRASDIPRLVYYAENGYDLAIGSRRVEGGSIVGWGWGRRLMSRMAMDVSRFFLGLKTKDVTAGFRCYRAKFLRTLPLADIFSDGYSFQEETLYFAESCGARIKEVPVVFNDRSCGSSKLSVWEIFKFFYTIIKLRVKHGKINATTSG